MNSIWMDSYSKFTLNENRKSNKLDYKAGETRVICDTSIIA